MLRFINKIVSFILGIILGKADKNIIKPSIYDQLPDNFHLIHNFLDKEFYHFLYQITNYQIDSFNKLNHDTELFKNNMISFILLFSHDSLEDSADEKKQRVAVVKELFYLEFCNLIISKMSKELRVLFYRQYQAKHRLSVIRNLPNNEKKIDIRNRVLNKLKEYQKEDNLLDIQNEEIEKLFNQIVLDIKIDMDLGLCEYIIDWVKLKIDFVGDDIKSLLEERKKSDPKFSEYIDKFTDLIPWGCYDPTFQNTAESNTDPLIHDFCLNTVQREYFLKKLRMHFDLNIPTQNP